jgi:mono/diheme cytochrome c family protein
MSLYRCVLRTSAGQPLSRRGRRCEDERTFNIRCNIEGEWAASSGGEVSYAGPIQSTDLALGERKFNSRCNGCHAGGPTLNGIGWTAERLRRQIREGSGGMNAIPASALSDSDMEAVLAYMVTIGGAVDEAPAAEPVAQ